MNHEIPEVQAMVFPVVMYGYELLLFSCLVVSDSLWSHGLQHTMLPCLLLSLRVCSNSWPLSQWHHPTISSSVIHFSSCLQSSPKSVSFLMSQFFISGAQSIGSSASASVLPKNIQDWFPLGLTGLISLQSKGLSRVSQESSPAPQCESISSLVLSILYGPTITPVHDSWKNHSFDCVYLCQQSDASVF